jgi:hypothetical protein
MDHVPPKQDELVVTTPVNTWGAISYGYKSPLLFIHNTRKISVFKQIDYLAQILKPHIQGILEAFAPIIHVLRPAEPLFIENGNSTHSHKSSSNYYAQ